MRNLSSKMEYRYEPQTMFRSTTDRIYDGDPIILQYYIIIRLCYNCLQYSVQQHAVQICSL